MKKFELVVTENGEPRVDSRLLAGAFGIDHESIMLLVKKHKESLEKGSDLKLEIGKSAKNQTVKFYLLTERQALNLTTYCRVNSKSILVKDKLVDTFMYYREQINQTIKLPTQIEVARLYLESLEKVEKLQIENKNLDKEAQKYFDELEEQDPIVEEWKEFLDSGQLISFKQFANMLKIPNFGRTKLCALLRVLKVLCGDNSPRQKYMEHFKCIPTNPPKHWKDSWKWSETTTFILPESFVYIKKIVSKALK